MTIKGAISELDTLINADDIPIWYKPSLEKIKETVADEFKEVPTGKWITTKQLEDMYKKYERKLWNEREDVRGDDMVEIGFAEQFLQDGLMELGCWDNDVVEEQKGEES